MIYLRYLATFLANGTFVVSVFSVMPRMPTINYVPSLPVTVTTAQHIVIHLYPRSVTACSNAPWAASNPYSFTSVRNIR